MNSIDLISFLRNYYGIINNDLKANKLTHYLHPHLLIDARCADKIYEQDENYIDISSIDLDNLSKDELLNLRKKVKENCQRASERAITKVIKRKRDKEVVDYKRKKLMLRMEEL